MYHRILKSESEEPVFVQPGMYVSVDAFRRQVAFLKEHFHVLPLTDMMRRVETGESLGGYCSLTFDDGWQDNFSQAFPILKEYNVPATVFLSSGFIGTTRLFWPEEVGYFLLHPGKNIPIGQSPVLDRFMEEVSETRTGRANLDRAIEILKGSFPDDREEILGYLRASSPACSPGRLLMSWEEAREMLASGLVRFGAHTVNHVILDQVPLPQAEEEIVRSRQQLEDLLGERIDLFAYPNGNYNGDLQAILKRHGFKWAVTTRKGWVGNGTSLLEIPRIGMHEDVSQTIPLFLARILLDGF